MRVLRGTSRVVLAAVLFALPVAIAAQDARHAAQSAGHALQEAARAAPDSTSGPVWFASIALGYGRLSVRSDQATAPDHGAFTLSLRGGRAINERLRVGLDVAGWLIEAGDVADPSKGASVSVTDLFAQVFPSSAVPWYVELGGGYAKYADNAPDNFGADGLGWTIGVGYELGEADRVRIVPSAQWSNGRFRDTRNLLLTRTGLAYDVWDLRVAAQVRFGGSGRDGAPKPSEIVIPDSRPPSALPQSEDW